MLLLMTLSHSSLTPEFQLLSTVTTGTKIVLGHKGSCIEAKEVPRETKKTQQRLEGRPFPTARSVPDGESSSL